MFTVSGLSSTGVFDFYRGSGAPVFRTFQTATTRNSAPAWRVRSNNIRYKFGITRETDGAAFLWKNPDGVLGSQEITIDISFLNGNNDDLLSGTESPELVESADTWINNTTIGRLVENYSVINKVTVGGIVFERFLGDLSPVTLPEGVFEYQRDSGTIRFQTPSDTLWVGDQPVKIWGSAALGSILDINTALPTNYDTIVRNNGIVQGIYKL